MKHVKLFEDFSMGAGQGPAQLLVSGDWTGITKDGSPENFIAPATFIFRYLPAGSPVPSGYKGMPISDLELIAEQAFGADQNGVNVAQEDLRLLIDPAISPSELESYLRNECDNIWGNTSDEEYYSISSLDTGNLDPKYLRLAMADKSFPRKVVFITE